MSQLESWSDTWQVLLDKNEAVFISLTLRVRYILRCNVIHGGILSLQHDLSVVIGRRFPCGVRDRLSLRKLSEQ